MGQCSTRFLVLPMLLVWHYTTQWSTGEAPVLLMGHYVTPVVTWWSTASATDLRELFLLSSFFKLILFAAFQGLPGASSSISRLAGLHADLWNLVPAQLFAWITAIHKRFICGRFYWRVRLGQSWEINLHRELILQNINFSKFASYFCVKNSSL